MLMQRYLIPVSFFLGLVTASMAATFYPIADISSSTSATDLYPVSNLIQGPGVGFDAAEPHGQTPDGPNNLWVTDAPGGFPSDFIAVAGAPVLTIDMGADVALSEISVWGYSSDNSNGASAFSLRFATDAEGTGGFGTSIAYNPTFNPVVDPTIRQSFDFSEDVTARWVEMTVDDNYFVAPGDGSVEGSLPGGDRVGLGEVAFVIPEPSVALFGLIALNLCFLRRRR